MITIPGTPQGPQAQQPKPQFLLMAAAMLHERMTQEQFDQRAKPMADAIKSGEVDPVGMNSTTFEKPDARK